MRLATVIVGLLLGSSVHAQEEVVWTTEDVLSTRFVGEEVEGPEFLKGTRLSVIYRQEGLARVYAGVRFGWISDTLLTTEDPSKGDSEPFQLDLDKFDLDALMPSP
jgi:hypothetical protein